MKPVDPVVAALCLYVYGHSTGGQSHAQRKLTEAFDWLCL